MFWVVFWGLFLVVGLFAGIKGIYDNAITPIFEKNKNKESITDYLLLLTVIICPWFISQMLIKLFFTLKSDDLLYWIVVCLFYFPIFLCLFSQKNKEINGIETIHSLH